MRKALQTVSWISLAAVLLPSVLFMSGSMTLDKVKLVMMLATIAWFIVTPLWMERKG
ncbi:MAG: hypothetical protein QGI24_04375 [Kiritimatiellia bacterium]|jgi:high-affinity nickel permease|nr:hypothetical protein [Kiritimatiellia bacterium]MDP6848003.1 hypothetical protein [Kiritimatiellia bacterium]